jgi:hypothetical protein
MLALTGRFRIYDTGVIVEPGKSRLFTRPRPTAAIQKSNRNELLTPPASSR